jgi:large subunit ribosomal protein L30
MSDLKITLVRSAIGLNETQKRTAKALGLTRMHKTVVRPDNPQIRGMVFSIKHLVAVAPADEAAKEG